METMQVRPKWLVWVALAALAWNLIGVAMFVMQIGLDGERLAALDAGQRQVRLTTPGWVDAAFALAVGGGVSGALGLLLRRAWAVPMFAWSLLGLLVQIAGVYAATPAWAVYGPAGLAMPALLLAIALGLWLLARKAARRGWLR